MSTCPFCLQNDLLDGEIIAQDAHAYLVDYAGPVLRNAVMIIPKRHVATPFDLSLEEWRATHVLLAAARRFLERSEPQGYSIGWNVHEVGGQTVPHAHLHVIARFADEPMAGKGIRHALKQESNLRRSLRS